MAKPRASGRTSFRDAISDAESLEGAWRPGLRALSGAHSRLLDAAGVELAGSLDLDDALARSLPNDPRWDYGVGVDGSPKSDRVVWIEVHPAHTSNVEEVLKKLAWLKSWLRSNATSLESLDAKFVWIASGGNHVRKFGREARRLRESGLLAPMRRYSFSKP